MCCGFGAVVLLVMILNGQTLQRREGAQKDLKAEIERVTLLKEYATAHLDELREEIKEVELQEGELRGKAEHIKKEISKNNQDNETADQQAKKDKEEVEAIQKEISELKKKREQKEAQANSQATDGSQIGFDGEGQRQYLTGLKLGGERTLILVDVSASMLDETLVNVIRRKLMDTSIRRRSSKWLRVVRSLHWIVANLKANKSFQVYFFNTKAWPAVKGSEQRWLNSSDPNSLDEAVAIARRIGPKGGTSLHVAFDVIKKMNPKPDSVILLTDGLPTQGATQILSTRSIPKSISGDERQKLFDLAVKRLPEGVPINTLLFPIEGDPGAASSYWELAIKTHGSFITPSRDWP